jgi:hypothetical protein
MKKAARWLLEGSGCCWCRGAEKEERKTEEEGGGGQAGGCGARSARRMTMGEERRELKKRRGGEREREPNHGARKAREASPSVFGGVGRRAEVCGVVGQRNRQKLRFGSSFLLLLFSGGGFLKVRSLVPLLWSCRQTKPWAKARLGKPNTDILIKNIYQKMRETTREVA